MKSLKEKIWSIKVFIQYFLFQTKETFINSMKHPNKFDIFVFLSIIIILLLKIKIIIKEIFLALIVLLIILRKKFMIGEHTHWWRKKHGYDLSPNPKKDVEGKQ